MNTGQQAGPGSALPLHTKASILWDIGHRDVVEADLLSILELFFVSLVLPETS